MSDELLYNKIYEKTKECGRSQFIKLLMQKERENQELKKQQKEYIEQLEKLAYQNMVPSDFANGCKVAYGIALNRYKEIIGGDNK